MGITKSDFKLLAFARKEGVSFERLLTLGRLTRYVSAVEVDEILSKYDNAHQRTGSVSGEYSDKIFELLGSKKYVSLDHSAYEGANLVHDLNLPLPQEHLGRYTCVLDSGTIEHVFNFPQAIKSCMDALAVGGHYIGITPANNLLGHGFYQFSPELYYRIFSPENGFEVLHMLIAPLNSDTNWYSVADPAKTGSRVTISSGTSITLMVIARKIKNMPVFSHFPMQSDYVQAWQHHHERTRGKSKGVKNIVSRLLPGRLKDFIVHTIDFFRKTKFEDDALGIIDPTHFRRVDF